VYNCVFVVSIVIDGLYGLMSPRIFNGGQESKVGGQESKSGLLKSIFGEAESKVGV